MAESRRNPRVEDSHSLRRKARHPTVFSGLHHKLQKCANVTKPISPGYCAIQETFLFNHSFLHQHTVIMPEQILDDISHRRYNPLTDSWLLVSPHRTKRPWQFGSPAPTNSFLQA